LLQIGDVRATETRLASQKVYYTVIVTSRLAPPDETLAKRCSWIALIVLAIVRKNMDATNEK
jgi:hypothetical protein